MAPESAVAIEPQALTWDDEADAVVVGIGGAGIACVLQACEAGLSVIACDRFSGGGATAHSGGIIYAGGTSVQSHSGITDSAEEMYRYLNFESSPVRDETLRRFCEGSAEDIAWLQKHGVPYSGPAYPEKAGFPPEGYFLYYSGNEVHPRFAARARPAQRGNRPVSQGITGGSVHFRRLMESAEMLGPKFLFHSPARRLITDLAGSVIGVEISAIPKDAWPEHDALFNRIRNWRFRSGASAERATKEADEFEARYTLRRRIRARRGVLLSTGGFVYNLRLLRTHSPLIADSYRDVSRLGVMGCDGSGIELGISVGGSTDLMDRLFVGRGLSPPNEQVTGVLVNRAGQRFVNEDAYVSLLGDAIASQPDGIAWLILSPDQYWRSLRWAFRPGKGLFKQFGAPVIANRLLAGTRRAKTPRALAKKCGVDADQLTQTISDYNKIAGEENEDPLGKIRRYIRSLGNGPYYAVNMHLANAFAFTAVFTLGGLRVDEDTGAVLRHDGTSIHGLYAAGRTAVGLCSNGYVSGMSIADTVFSGRRAARSMAPAG